MPVPPRTAHMPPLPGWAACCYGDKAEKIRADGNNTRDIESVTCRACISRIRQSVELEKAEIADRMWEAQREAKRAAKQ